MISPLPRGIHAALLALALAGVALAQTQTVWQLGKFDHMAREFHGRELAAPVDVNLAEPGAENRWPARQAGTRNAKELLPARTRTLRFSLDAEPSGSYTLDIAVMLGNPRIPRLVLELNGTPASVYFHRELTYIAEGRADSPVNGEARTRIPVPVSVLRRGENVLKVTAVDDEADENGDSSLEWDALALVHSADAAAPLARVDLEPTFFYTHEQDRLTREPEASKTAPAAPAPDPSALKAAPDALTQPHGALKEVVEVTVSLPRVVRQAGFMLKVNGGLVGGGGGVGRMFGQLRIAVSVPEFAANSKAEVELTLDGRAEECAAPPSMSPKRKFTVIVVPHNHLDIGFTDYQPKIEELQNRNLDRLLEEMHGDADHALLARRRVAGGAVPAHAFARGAEASSSTRYAPGRISIPAQYANLMAGGASLETLIRSLYAGHALEPRGGPADATTPTSPTCRPIRGPTPPC